MKFFQNIEHEFKMKRQYKVLRGVKIDVSQAAIDAYVKEQIVRGIYESEEYYILSECLKSEDRVLELGACVGFLSAAAAKVCGSKNVMCVEANPALIDVIKTNHDLNGVSPKTIAGIASDNDGEDVSFFVGERATGSSLLKRQGSREITQQTVDVNRLIEEFAPTFLMMDIEGSEIDLLPKLDLSALRIIVVEFHPKLSGYDTITACIQQIIDKGFVLRIDKFSNKCVVFESRNSQDLRDNKLLSQPIHELDALPL